MAKLQVLSPDLASIADHWMEVHAAGCAHLRTRRCGRRLGTDAYPLEASTRTEAALDVAEDFIREGSMTEADALECVHFAPCALKALGEG